MTRPLRWLTALAVSAAGATTALAVERFPPPEFETSYQMPQTTTPAPWPAWWGAVDVALLTATLALASYFILRRRSRRAILLLSVFSLAYFGFYRQGCVCPIGAIQNVALALANPAYTVPLVVLAFFLLPLVFTLFVGRAFCSGVCPFGALQDLVLFRPVTVPRWAEAGLGLLAHVYLAAAVLLAATGTTFLICRYDPFVGFFRFAGHVDVIVLGVCFVVLSLFVGRPYCRFVCPYGAVLRLLSSVSRRNVSIYPDRCVQCRLCEAACPYGAIKPPAATPTPDDRAPTRRRVALFALALPALVLVLGYLTAHAATRLVWAHPAATPSASAELLASLHSRFYWGGWLAGGYLGLVIGGKLLSLSVFARHRDYQADPGLCMACARCYDYCPKHWPPDAPTLVPVTVSAPAAAAVSNGGRAP